MKICLIQPPIRDFYFTPMRSFPLGLCYLAASLSDAGHEVTIYDCMQGGKKSARVKDDHAFDYLKPFYHEGHLSPFGMFGALKHYGVSFDVIREHVASVDAEVFGITSLFSAYADEALTVARIIKEEKPNSTVVLGGFHAHAYADYIITHHPYIDHIIRGEGDTAFVRLVADLAHAEQSHGPVNRVYAGAVPDLAALAWPKRDLLDLDLYTIGKKRYTPIITSRGCPMQCSFCSIPDFLGHTMRERDIDDTCHEILHCHDAYGIRIFDIEDDNFTVHKSRTLRLLAHLKELLGEREIEITAMNGLYYQSLDDEILDALYAAGMRRINLSLVTSSEQTTDGITRSLNVDCFQKVVHAAVARGMHVTAYYIIGLPGETIDAMLKTLKVLSSLPVLIGASMYYHVPGSQLFDACMSKGEVLVDDYRFFRATAMWYECDAFSRVDVATLFRLTRLLNFIKPLLHEGQSVAGIKGVIAECVSAIRKTCGITDTSVVTDKALIPDEIGIVLLDSFLRDYTLYSLQKNTTPDKQICYTFVPEIVSPDVINLFCNLFYL